MNIPKKLAYGISLCLAFAVFTGTGCSYVVDSFEGAITKRSSFSVNAAFSGSYPNYTVTLDWSNSSPSVDSSAFAGYEVYITKDVDDEFSGYELVASGVSMGVSGGTIDSFLLNASTDSISFAVPSSYTLTPGSVYYFRVGVINWSEAKESDRSSKWTSAKGYESDWGVTPGYIDYFYPLKSNLDKISGGARVEF